MSKAKAGALALAATMALTPAVADGKRTQSAPKTVPGKEFASALKSQLPKSTGVKVTKATCPKKIRNRKKQTATCKVTFASADAVRVRVTLTDTNGGFKAKLLDMLMRRLESQMEAQIQAFPARAVCPEKRTIKKSDTFTCDLYHATEKKLAGFIDATQIGNGNVQTKGRNPTPESTPVNPVPADMRS